MAKSKAFIDLVDEKRSAGKVILRDSKWESYSRIKMLVKDFRSCADHHQISIPYAIANEAFNFGFSRFRIARELFNI